MYEIIVYTTVNISNLISPIANVTIKNIAKNVAATSHGHLSIFCKTIDNMTTAKGIAKNNSNKSIYKSHSSHGDILVDFFNYNPFYVSLYNMVFTIISLLIVYIIFF